MADDESTTPDLLELVRGFFEAGNRRDVDAMMRFLAPDMVVDDPEGVGTLKGVAIREFLEDWFASYEAFEIEVEEALDLSNGVAFVVYLQKGRPAGSTGEVQLRQGWITLGEDGLIGRIRVYYDIDEARAAAERFAQERAHG